MPYDLEVYGNLEGSNVIERWEKLFLEKGVKVSFHPDTDLNDQFGYLPLKIEFIED